MRYAGIAADRAAARVRRADLAVFHQFAPPPSGGGNQFLSGLVRELEARGLRVERNTISATTRACLFNSFNFDFERLRLLARAGCRMVHRVDGPIGVYRGFDDGTDERIADVNRRLAQATIFQSEYSRRRHEELGIELVNPVVIHNAVDPLVFHPEGRTPFEPERRVRVIAVSWSDNPNKGGAVYKRLEELLDWSRYEFTFVGRTAVPFERARTIPPVGSNEVAELLRNHDVFVTASRHEACPNALLEALACGLPTLYVDSGAHPELVGGAGLPFDDADELPALLDRIVDGYERFQAAIETPLLADVADRYLAVLGWSR